MLKALLRGLLAEDTETFGVLSDTSGAIKRTLRAHVRRVKGSDVSRCMPVRSDGRSAARKFRSDRERADLPDARQGRPRRPGVGMVRTENPDVVVEHGAKNR